MDYIRNLAIASLCTCVLTAQSPPAASTTAKVVITMGHFYGKTAPVVTANDVTVTERFEELPVAGLVPFTGERAGLELFLLVDQCSDCEPGTKMAEAVTML